LQRAAGGPARCGVLDVWGLSPEGTVPRFLSTHLWIEWIDRRTIGAGQC